MVRGIRLSLSSQGRAIQRSPLPEAIQRSPLLGSTSAPGWNLRPIGGIQTIDMRHPNFPVGQLRQSRIWALEGRVRHVRPCTYRSRGMGPSLAASASRRMTEGLHSLMENVPVALPEGMNCPLRRVLIMKPREGQPELQAQDETKCLDELLIRNFNHSEKGRHPRHLNSVHTSFTSR